MIKLLREKLQLKAEEEMGQRQEGGKKGRKGDKMGRERRREQEAGNGGVSEETGRDTGGSKLRQMNSKTR